MVSKIFFFFFMELLAGYALVAHTATYRFLGDSVNTVLLFKCGHIARLMLNTSALLLYLRPFPALWPD